MEIVRDGYEAMLAHAREAYPHECCGILAGRIHGDERRVERVYRARNLNRERAHDRYELDPADFLRVDRELEGSGLSVIGFYHSHPDHPARPSRFDRERAWPVYVYLIVSVTKGEPAQARAWILEGEGDEFRPEPLTIVP